MSKDKNIKQLGSWINTQQYNYVKKQHNMKDENIRKKWEEFINDNKYKQYFISNEEDWNNKLKEVMKYIDDNNKRPSSEDKIKNIKQLGQWILIQKYNYDKENCIMKDKNIRKKWEQFINNDNYKKYFIKYIKI